MRKIIGIDAGGTKTSMVLFDEKGNQIDTILCPTCHFLQVGYDTMEKILQKGISTLLQKHHIDSSNIAIGFGLAGYGQEKKVREEIEQRVQHICKEIPYVLRNDVQIALAGATGLQDGIVVIAGTGSIAFSMHNGITRRCGGWGYQLGDEGSAYAIGKKVLQVFTHQCDGRAEKSALFEKVMNYAKLEEPHDIIGYTNKELNFDRTKIAAFAQLCYEAAQEKDAQAIAIYKETAADLGKLIQVLAKDFPDKVHVSYIGGVFQSKDFILNPLQEVLPVNADICPPLYTPEMGAFMLVQEMLKER